MSLMDAPMALIDRILRRPPVVPPDDPVARLVERLAHELEPDPLYRRRLRGEALNRFVAAREGISEHRPRTRGGRMTPIGRGVLLASLLQATGAASVSAASQVAMPGDALYGVKLRIEQLRIEVAPGDLKDELVAASLDARLAEIQVLAERGDWAAAGTVSERAVEIAAALLTMSPQLSPATEVALDRHVAVLEAVLADAPAAAADALQGALDASSTAASAVKQNGWRAPTGPNPPGHAAPPAIGASSPGEPSATPHPGHGNGPGSDSGSAPGSNSAGAPGSNSGKGPSASGAPSPGPTNSGETGGAGPAAPDASASLEPTMRPRGRAD
jgi:hypothetical protein